MTRDAQPLTDAAGRRFKKLRVSLTDVCNFRCFYCMPDKVKFESTTTLLAPEAIVSVAAGLLACGVTQVRLTGGEPTLRREFRAIVEGLSALPLETLALTTNGYSLVKWLPFLAQTACRALNVSLDSLQPERFAQITKTRLHREVMDGILAAQERGFSVKVNVVVARGVNDDEIEDFVAFSARHRIPVRFLEFMRIGPAGHRHAEYFVAAADLISRIERTHALEFLPSPADATAFRYATENGAELGFIASESRPFCAGCSRLRLSARGRLRACLMNTHEVDIRGVDQAAYPGLLADLLLRKPMDRIPALAQPMYQIGG